MSFAVCLLVLFLLVVLYNFWDVNVVVILVAGSIFLSQSGHATNSTTLTLLACFFGFAFGLGSCSAAELHETSCSASASSTLGASASLSSFLVPYSITSLLYALCLLHF